MDQLKLWNPSYFQFATRCCEKNALKNSHRKMNREKEKEEEAESDQSGIQKLLSEYASYGSNTNPEGEGEFFYNYQKIQE